VRFRVDNRAVTVDHTAPYQLVIRSQDLARSPVKLRARNAMRDGRRAVLSRDLRRC
jgi:hypothetical protein